MYKLIKSLWDSKVDCVHHISNNTFIPLVDSNTDYAKFKADILENKAELQDAEGNTMTAQDAQAFVATLP